jgi:4-aminobutyrate aminotransferase-like enzyme
MGEPLGALLPQVRTDVPGPASRGWVDRLAQRECPAITARRARRAAALGVADTDPVVWAEARGANVRDVDGNVFVDLTAGFGVAALGHGHPALVAALTEQAGLLVHAMGDAFPDPRRVELLEALAAISGLDRGILGSSGADAVEAALKTARLATGRAAVLSFDGGYHGLSYGALAVLGHRPADFAGPFADQLGPHGRRGPFGGPLPDLSGVGAVLVEPILGRGGVVLPPAGWLAELVHEAHKAGAVVIFDEIYTGFGRTGAWLRHPAEGASPDLLCVGKGLAGGFPVSACLGTAAVMDAWGASKGEALHTQTFLGNPMGCAMALASLRALDGVIPTVEPKAQRLRARLADRGFSSRGAGLLIGVPLPDAFAVCQALLRRGFLVLPSGPRAEVLCLTPPLTIEDAQLDAFVDALAEVAPAPRP